jgi:hypothetical protein
MNGKLSVVVRVDLEGATTRIGVKGRVNSRNVQALPALARRAGSLVPGTEVIIDLSRADAAPEALALLNDCAESGHLPEIIDPAQAEYRLQVIAPALTQTTSGNVGLAA